MVMKLYPSFLSVIFVAAEDKRTLLVLRTLAILTLNVFLLVNRQEYS